MKKIATLACLALLGAGAQAGDSPVLSTAASATGGIVIGGGAPTGGNSGSGGGSNVQPGSPIQVLLSGGPMVVSGGDAATNAQIIAAMEAAGIPTDNVTFSNE